MVNDTDYEDASVYFTSINKITDVILNKCNTALKCIIKELSATLDINVGSIFRYNFIEKIFQLSIEYTDWEDVEIENKFDVLSIAPQWQARLNYNESIIIEDVYKCEFDHVLTAYLYRKNIKSLLLFPIFYRKKLHGYLRLDNIHEIKKYSETELMYINAAANVIKTFFCNKEKEQILDTRDFEKILNVINDAAVIFDKSGIVINANKEFARRYNTTLDEVIGGYVWSNYTDNNVFKARMDTVKRVVETGKPAVGEDNIGDDWYNYRVYPIKDDAGNVVRLAAFSRDITKLMRTYYQNKEQKEKYTALFDNMRCSVAVYEAVDGGANFIIKNMNKAGEKIDQVEREKIIGKKVTDVFPGVIDFGLFDVFKKVYETGIPEEVPIKKYKDDNLDVWRSNYVYRLPSGEVVAVYSDHTKLMKTEHELAQSKRYLELALEGTGAGIWEWDIENDLLTCSEKWAEIIGYKLKELEPINKVKWNSICHPDDIDKINESLKKHLEGKTDFYENEIRLKHKDGHWVWVLDRGSVVKSDKNEKPIFMSGIHIDISELVKTRLERNEYFRSLGKILNDIVAAISIAVDIRDKYTGGHQEKVAELSEKIAIKMNLPEDKINNIITAAKLHDIGKIYIPDSILNKPDKLSNNEFEIIKTHVKKGYEILKTVAFPGNIAIIVKQHHERLNGSGYPDGLKDGDILLEASIVAVADVVDAMISARPYRKALPVEKAIAELKDNAGILYDAKVVDACISVLTKD